MSLPPLGGWQRRLGLSGHILAGVAMLESDGLKLSLIMLEGVVCEYWLETEAMS